MGENRAVKWLKDQVVAPHSPLKRAVAQLAFYLVALAVLWGHALLLPPAFKEGQVMPYTIVAPASFDVWGRRRTR